MKTYIKNSLLFLFSFSSNLCSASVAEEEKEDKEIPSVKWTSTLNFSYKKLGKVLKTGSDGNTDLVYAQDQKEKGLADVDTIHRGIKKKHEEFKKNLSKKEQNQKNLVVVGISLLLAREDNQRYCMIFDFYRETQSKKILVFRSGTNNLGGSKNSDEHVFVHIHEENEDLFTIKNLEDYWNKRNKCYRKKIKNLKESDWRKSFVKKWKDYLDNTEKIRTYIKSAITRKGVKNGLEEQQKLTEREFLRKLVKEANDKLGDVGSIADSEQVFMFHSRIPLSSSTNLEKAFNNLYSRAKTEKKPIGLIIHIHSTRDFCTSCAASLSQEIFRKKSDTVGRLLESIQKKKNSPFIMILGSCDKLMDSGGVPVGVKEYIPINKLDMDTMLREKWFPQTHSILHQDSKRKFSKKLGSEINLVKGFLERKILEDAKKVDKKMESFAKKSSTLIFTFLYGSILSTLFKR